MRYDVVAFLKGLTDPAPDVKPDDLSAEWREVYNERAAIREMCGGLPRELAEVTSPPRGQLCFGEALGQIDVPEQVVRDQGGARSVRHQHPRHGGVGRLAQVQHQVALAVHVAVAAAAPRRLAHRPQKVEDVRLAVPLKLASAQAIKKARFQWKRAFTHLLIHR